MDILRGKTWLTCYMSDNIDDLRIKSNIIVCTDKSSVVWYSNPIILKNDVVFGSLAT